MITKTVNQKGYTLIEILIAMMVFAVLSTITSYAIKRFQDQMIRIKDNYQFIKKIDQFIHKIQFQSQHLILRSILSNEGRSFPIFIGQEDYVEWTYTHEHEHQLARIAYLCKNQQLLQRQWPRLDTINRNNFKDIVILTHLTDCRFRYLDQNGQALGYFINSDEQKYPKGLQVLLTFSNQRDFEFWFAFQPQKYNLKNEI